MTRIHQKNVHKNAYTTLSGGFDGNRPLGSPRHTKEFCIQMDLEIAHDGMHWIRLIHGRSSGVIFNNTLQDADVPYNKFPD